MAEPEKPPDPAEAVGPPAAPDAANPPPPPPPGDAAAAGAPGALQAEGGAPAGAPPTVEGAPAAAAAAAGPPAEGGTPAAEGTAPAESAPPPELTPEELEVIEKERIRLEEEAEQQELKRMRLEELPNREQRQREEEEGKRIVSARLRMLAEARLKLRAVHRSDFQQEDIHVMRQESLELQKRVVALQKKRKSVDTEKFILDGKDAYYYARLTKWNDTKFEFSKMKEDLDKKIDNLRDKLQVKTDEANARHEGLIHYLWKIARNSQDIVSFQRIPKRVLHELEEEERDSIAELQAVRTRGRMLKKQLAKLELRLALKDQLQLETGNLHLVDYDQLKMENESLHQKIQMKNEALSTLKKKTALLVHILQHTREKIQFLDVECAEKGEELANDDKALHGGRVKISHMKTLIVTINRKRNALAKRVVYIKLPMIWDDMDYQREDIEAEEQTFKDLKKRYHELTMKIQEIKNCLYGLKALPLPSKKRFIQEPLPSPSLEHSSLRWGTQRDFLGQMVVRDMVDLMAKQNDAKPKYDFGSNS